jgi:hypothetical protein
MPSLEDKGRVCARAEQMTFSLCSPMMFGYERRPFGAAAGLGGALQEVVPPGATSGDVVINVANKTGKAGFTVQ